MKDKGEIQGEGKGQVKGKGHWQGGRDKDKVKGSG